MSQWRGYSSVIPAQLCLLYSTAMARIFLYESCTTLLLVFRGDGAGFFVIQAHILLRFVHIYVVLVHNANCFRH